MLSPHTQKLPRNPMTIISKITKSFSQCAGLKRCRITSTFWRWVEHYFIPAWCHLLHWIISFMSFCFLFSQQNASSLWQNVKLSRLSLVRRIKKHSLTVGKISHKLFLLKENLAPGIGIWVTTKVAKHGIRQVFLEAALMVESSTPLGLFRYHLPKL